MTHICVSKLTIVGSDNGLSPGRCQTTIRTNDGIILIRILGTNFSEILSIFIQENAFENVICEMASILSRPQCLNSSSFPSLLIVRTFVCLKYSLHFIAINSALFNQMPCLPIHDQWFEKYAETFGYGRVTFTGKLVIDAEHYVTPVSNGLLGVRACIVHRLAVNYFWNRGLNVPTETLEMQRDFAISRWPCWMVSSDQWCSW